MKNDETKNLVNLINEIKNKETLIKIVKVIKGEHKSSNKETFISEDSTNERLTHILIDFDLIDDSECLENVFGFKGLEVIREAESGCYSYIENLI